MAKGPYLPEPREDCEGAHVHIMALEPEDQAQCRYCGHLLTPKGRVSKRNRAELPVETYRRRAAHT